ncbi:UNVERIFIED_CONTAM: AT-hook motif nuclear-localized protein 17 [Sesamum angustifolium]|uniref:AT-hook motif nuclear-localized protein 17 n=1 Tax=Sesamum angustifolium TaxID=2727405 RepID=A0AAW2LYN5_9LAMI
MKRKCIEEDHPTPPPPPSPCSPPHHHHTPKFHLQTTTSEEADSHSSAKSNAKDDSFPPPPTTHDGATIEVVRRPRGRPPGSKNKPKPPVIITRDSSEPSMSPYVLELPAGVDVVESTSRFCRKRNMGLCVLNGNGVVANVTPAPPPRATVTFHGVSIPLRHYISRRLRGWQRPFAICLAGPQGQPTFDRLQAAEHEDTEARDGAHDPHESPQTVSGADSGGAHIYSYQPSDVIWAPTARQPPPPPPPY